MYMNMNNVLDIYLHIIMNINYYSTHVLNDKG